MSTVWQPQNVTGVLATVRASGATPAVKLAFEFLILTAARSGEVRGARWDEMDTQARVWAVPVARMKMKRDHRVLLCGRAMEILDAARTLSDDAGPLVFPGRSGRPLACLIRAKLTLHSGIVWPKSFQISELEAIDAGSWLAFRF